MRLALREPLLRLIVVLAICLPFAACGGGEEAAPSGQTPGATSSAGPVSIDLWHSETAANQDTLKSLIDRFNASQDQVKVRLVYQGTTTDLMAKLVSSLGSGQVPAIAAMSEVDTQRLLDSGAFVPIQDLVDRDGYDLSDLDERAVKYFTVQDQLWAMPFAANVPLLYYNKTMFQEVGLDPDSPPRDLEELRSYSEKILQRDASGQVARSGIALDIRLWTDMILAEHGDFLVNNDNGREGRATAVLFDNDTARWFFNWWHDMVSDGLAFNVGRNPTFVDTFLAMSSGRAAMAISYASALRSVVDALEKGVQGVEIGIGALPGVPGSTESPSFLGNAFWILSARPAEEQEAAWTLIKWLLEPEQQAEWFAGSGYLPVSLSSLDLPAATEVVARYPLFETALDLYRKGSVTPASLGALLGPFSEVHENILRAIEEMLYGTKDPEQALKDAATASDQAIENYNQRLGE
jgi:sn-glycerol 3-phosphate transport system substrate-binding protein